MNTETAFPTPSLEPGEELLFRRKSPTFHRSHDPTLAVSNRALYFPKSSFFARRFRGYFVRFPISSVKRIIIQRRRTQGYHRVLANVILFGAVTGMVVLLGFVVAGKAKVVGFVPLLFLLWIAWLSGREEERWVAVLVEHDSGTHEWNTPPDVYEVEIEYDLQLVREFAAAARAAGVPEVAELDRAEKARAGGRATYTG